MLKSIPILPIFLAACIFFSCNSKPGPAAEEKEATETEVHAEDGVSMTADQIKSIGLQLGSIENKELSQTVKAMGMLTVPNENKAFVTPLSGGVLCTLNVRPGAFVKKGQVLATLVNPDLIPLQQQLQQLNAQIQLAELEVTRQQELYKGNAAPLKNYQRAQTELKTLRSQRSGIEQQLSTLGAGRSFSATLAIRAPISGTVSKVMAQIGSNVTISAPIAEVVNNSLIHLDLNVYEKDLPLISVGQVIHFTLTNNPGKEYDASVFSIGTAFEGDTKSVPVHASVTGDKTGLIDGMGVTANISLNTRTAPAVPDAALVNYQGKDYIFIVAADPSIHRADEHAAHEEGHAAETHFTMIPVARGVSDVGYTQITPLASIPPGAKVAVKGAFFLLAKITNTEGHAH
ncbi:efflux RND transporter periplasmic adaptor subunit [Niabella sp. CC-SYL272]|uniref:efflux RND transporter periplasmic adaptor subunit n=1 Tax=Niabella agricola TaxID=2891571 RepID=UPI001F452DB6|nr:efflux RND transporter periplasmic adaptor subunit [Niabella agricola]MCF3107891.1 efflux RND transporter periplasmic adaptor subunit [Niabella agricola]